MAKAKRSKSPVMITANSDLPDVFTAPKLLEDGVYQGTIRKVGVTKDKARIYFIIEVQGRDLWRTYSTSDKGRAFMSSELRRTFPGMSRTSQLIGKSVWSLVETYKGATGERNQIKYFVSEPTLADLGTTVDDNVIDKN